ncbi:DUF1513 domain-containing protein [Woeseia oceani]|uniref:DUF1513 domain-containing protein n=1 Tax=Woeseia oceani TaxID=1548547 RepID=UPI0009F5995C|nr:DUF1513 domain-containing protein [Woeseia oceani]
MAIDRQRRGLLLGCGAAAANALAWRYFGPNKQLLLSACDDRDGQHFLAAIDSNGKLTYRIPVPHRAHDIVMLSAQRAMYIGRRPAPVAYVVDIDAGALVRTLHSPAGRHFYGHGALAADGLLYTSENAFEDRRGMIAVWDTNDDFRRLGEFDSGGVGPHDMAFLSDGKTLVVANGGIETHPDSQREKLNIPTMQPSLVYLDCANGQTIERYFPDDHLMSLRHLAVTAEDRVIIGVQYEGDESAIVPLLLTHRGEDRLQSALAGPAVWRSHRNYIASVAASHDGRYAMLTAPRGGLASMWNLSTLEQEGQWRIRDVAGISSTPDGEIKLSNGYGQLFSVRAEPGSSALHRDGNFAERWDNHLLLV